MIAYDPTVLWTIIIVESILLITIFGGSLYIAISEKRKPPTRPRPNLRLIK